MANTKKVTTPTAAPTSAPITKKAVKITDDMIINVKSGVFGTLVYVDRKTGEEVTWENEGDIQQVSFALLRSMKASQVAFMKDNWILIDSVEGHEDIAVEDVYKALFVQQYYKNIIDPDDYSVVCSWSLSDIEKKIPSLTKNAKTNLAIALNTYIESGDLDSLKKIKAFEKALDCSLCKPE